MGLSSPAPHPAPAFALTDQRGLPTSVPAQPGRVIVLTFFNAPCNDICPVLAAELEQADAALGAEASNIEFVTVNTDPSALAQSDETPSVQGTGLGSLPNWHMVTGPLPTLNSLWKSYGVSISVSEKTGLEAHNDIMDFIDPRGDIRYRATPFADETHDRDLQPAGGNHCPLGPRDRHVRRTAPESMSAPAEPTGRPPVVATAPWPADRGRSVRHTPDHGPQ